MNKLEINKEKQGDVIILKCAGRLDTYWAGHLNDYINGMIREGHYQISLDMTGIEYISSGGIRYLLIQNKNLEKVQGNFSIIAMSDNVKNILSMVGLLDMLSRKAKQAETSPTKEEIQNQLKAHNFNFKLSNLSMNGKSNIDFYGNPELFKQSGFKAHHTRLIKSNENHFSIGLGAIGDSFDECKNRFGEYVMLGKNIAYMPADGFKKPDYMVSSGKLVASLTELYGLHFEGNFSHLVHFEPEKIKTTIRLSELLENIKKLTNYKVIGMVMLAESGGLIGASLNASPVEGKKILGFPEIINTFNFTTEHANNKMLTLSVGCFSFEKEEKFARYLRPVHNDSPIMGHIHSTVFPYVPLRKQEIKLNETIEDLFNTSELIDVLHLMNDNREIAGLGESHFTHGFCWIVPIQSTNKISTQ
ncbi:STAS domain-containing protein [candidate division KSB1 bacterium]